MHQEFLLKFGCARVCALGFSDIYSGVAMTNKNCPSGIKPVNRPVVNKPAVKTAPVNIKPTALSKAARLAVMREALRKRERDRG